MLKRCFCVIISFCLLLGLLPAAFADEACEHDYVSEQVPATCTEPAGIRYTCSKCGDTRFEPASGAEPIDPAAVEITERCPSKYANHSGSYGRVETKTYVSTASGGRTKKVSVVYPLNYDETKQYPVIYLLHGIFGDHTGELGDAKTIQAMVADGLTPDAFIICPNMYSGSDRETPAYGSFNAQTMENYDNFVNDLVDDLMPFLKENYPILEGKENTAVCGFSMGGRESLAVGLFRPDLIGYVGAFSPAPGLVPGRDSYMTHPGTFQESEVNYEGREAPYLITISCGTADSVVGQFPKSYHELYEENGVAHVWWEIQGSDHGDPATASGVYNFCRYVFKAESKASEPLGHDYVSDVTEPDCINAGYTLLTCTRCGDSYITDGTEPLGHDYVNGVCTRCGEKDPDAQPAFEFDDVKDAKKFYYAPVYWAYNHEPQITKGTTDTLFGPGDPCTRGQVVTFLWRAAGEPAPKSAYNPFTDVGAKKFYYSAVLWAVEQGITNGMSATTFEPDAVCNRGQIVTFLWRYAGEKAPESSVNPFTDVGAKKFYYKAVLWAVENNVTSGMTKTTFEPDSVCTRGQVVTFLYRTPAPAERPSAKLAFVGEMTLAGEDMNASTLRGMREFALDNGCEVVTCEPADPEDLDAVKAEIDAAIADGCELVVMTGFLYADACKASAEAHPETSFLLLDVSQYDFGGEVPQNVALVTYKEEQAGFLAGYAAVADGCSELGFLGGFPYPSMIRYGYGFVQGADAAALDYARDVHIRYWYANSFAPSDEITEKMKGWYEDGAEVVFACGGGIVVSCIEAAEEAGGKVIGVDVDQSALSDCVMTSAMKDLYRSVQVMLIEWLAERRWSGAEVRLGFLENAVALPIDTSRFTNFDAYDYGEMRHAFSNGKWTVSDECDAEKHPSTVRTTVDWQ